MQVRYHLFIIEGNKLDYWFTYLGLYLRQLFNIPV